MRLMRRAHFGWLHVWCRTYKQEISLNADNVKSENDNVEIALSQSKDGVIQTSGDEFFSEDQYGVKASPRVANVTALALNGNFNDRGSSLISYAGQAGLAPPATKLKRGGGRAQIGKPYTIRGKRFVRETA